MADPKNTDPNANQNAADQRPDYEGAEKAMADAQPTPTQEENDAIKGNVLAGNGATTDASAASENVGRKSKDTQANPGSNTYATRDAAPKAADAPKT